VPIALGGLEIPAQLVVLSVQAVDIAATLTAYLGIKPPPGSAGVPLEKVFLLQFGSLSSQPDVEIFLPDTYVVLGTMSCAGILG
jgi:hypothetical protein